MNWIHVNTEMPPDFEDVLVAVLGDSDAFATMLYWNPAFGWCWPGTSIQITKYHPSWIITHWLPLCQIPMPATA